MLQNATHDLVMRHQPIALKLARTFSRDRHGMVIFPEDELLSAANVGLAKAATTFKPDRGVKFGAYAKAVARNEVIDFTRKSEGARAGQQKQRVQNFDEAAWERIGARQSVDREAWRNIGTHAGEFSIEEFTMLDQGMQVWLRRLAAALAALSPRQRAIYTARHLRETPEKLADLARRFDISIERVSKLDMRTAHKVRELITIPREERFKRASLSARLQQETEALRPAKDPADNVTRRVVTGRFSIGGSPDRATLEERLIRTARENLARVKQQKPTRLFRVAA